VNAAAADGDCAAAAEADEAAASEAATAEGEAVVVAAGADVTAGELATAEVVAAAAGTLDEPLTIIGPDPVAVDEADDAVCDAGTDEKPITLIPFAEAEAVALDVALVTVDEA